ncbi:MAG: exopolysaccharide Pel transporter PelG [Planctomycetota bacterium]|jgi:uncharacterized membrane protein|nr:exopolysaccharide Pel transporter PelG [Planctomycetota bacterium]
MAGIGFRLKRLLSSNNYRDLVSAYGYSAIVSSGSWMMSMISLIAVGFFISSSEILITGGREDAAVFRIAITYIYAGSLILGGGFHLGTARFISDRLYAGHIEDVLPCFMRAAAALLGFSFVLSGLWFAFSGLGPVQAVACLVMFQSLSLVWLAMVFLSAAKGYEMIVWGFFFCHVAGTGLAIGGYRLGGLDFALSGYALGQLLLAFWLSWRIFREFPSYNPETSDVFDYLRGNRILLALGLIFNLSIWVDKLIIWYSPLGRGIVGWFRCADSYDTCLFFSYLTIIPAMSLFLIRIETSFYRAYSIFFTAVVGGGDLDSIMEGKAKIRASLWLSITRLAKSQGAFTLCLVIAAPIIEPYLGVGVDNIPTLRFALIAAFLQALLLFLLIFLLYFDWHEEAIYLGLLFLMLNAILTGLTVMLFPQFLGLGYLFALLISLVAGVFLFNAGMERLEFETFAKQSAV